MPAVNHVILASGAVVAVSAVVAAAIAIYESPELRRYTDDVRRRIAMALQSLGEGINPPDREPMFNRPEDAEGFLESRRGAGAEPGVDADEATRRSQREELMYWNSVRLQRQLEDELVKHAENGAGAATPAAIEARPEVSRGRSFDDFLKPANSEETGAYIVSGAQTNEGAGQLRHRGEGARGFSAAAVYSNPFSDENHIDPEEFGNMGLGTGRLMQESHSDIYSATTREEDRQTATTATMEAESPSLIDFSSETLPHPAAVADEVQQQALPDGAQEAAYESIQAWARDSGFYSPLPVTPVAPASEAEIASDGELTPTDSVSLVGSGEHVVDETHSSRAGESGRPFDVLSETDGMLTPASWSEVGSQISENEHPQAQHA
ncbi:hypothetical protein IF1G_06809 [Cordyceps javanica]|uniref:Uncharacterized protein n=1 Tax=Cordyceps javanica TaxID=43265 RepID=A0A545UZB6_9HYPO|nr:hypothetical protein IF1G_06809 [Cordyceps javanica]TQW06672.1 hypothetical protein IF2G_06094 [Cordyceps javanica]